MCRSSFGTITHTSWRRGCWRWGWSWSWPSPGSGPSRNCWSSRQPIREGVYILQVRNLLTVWQVKMTWLDKVQDPQQLGVIPIPLLAYKCFLNKNFDSNKHKGTVSRELRHRLLYIIWKLFSRPIVASLNFNFIKGQFTMYKKQFSVS